MTAAPPVALHSAWLESPTTPHSFEASLSRRSLLRLHIIDPWSMPMSVVSGG